MYTLDPTTIVTTYSFSSVAMVLLILKGQDGLARKGTCAIYVHAKKKIFDSSEKENNDVQ